VCGDTATWRQDKFSEETDKETGSWAVWRHHGDPENQDTCSAAAHEISRYLAFIRPTVSFLRPPTPSIVMR
jgi:hypothetical protein